MEIKPYEDKYKDQVIKLIFDIQEVELGHHSKNGRPDIKNIPAFYQKNERENFWLAIDENDNENDNVVGSIALSDCKNGNGELRRMYVKKNMRRQGVATELLARLLDFAKQKQYKVIYAITDDEPGAKHDFYKRNGFKRTEFLPEEIDYSSNDNVFYKLEIK